VQNTITVKDATRELINHLITMSEVNWISSDEPNEVTLPNAEKTFVNSELNQQDIESNVRWVNAHKLWELGFTGKNTVVGGADTGIEFEHPALVQNYRGRVSNGIYNHNFNWYDGVRNFNPCRSPCGCNLTKPCDDHGHGTHTLGTAVGGIARKIGASPDSLWIGCRPFTDTGRHYSVQTFLACLQFFLAPTDVDGKNPNPTLRPHSTIHSYGCNSGLGCPGPNDLEPASDALRASGVLMVVAAHNQGSGCSTITRQPCFFKSVITIGATNKDADTIAGFSSRGPVRLVNGTTYRKPDLTAPGVNVLSANRGGTYSSMSGTSMSTPLVAGCLALFWSAVPRLSRNIEKTMEIFERTAKHQTSTDCGSTGFPNNVYGYGSIDVLKAYQSAKELGY